MSETQNTTELRPHRGWQIPELVARIVEFCAPVSKYPALVQRSLPLDGGFGDLCALARTSRLLQDPALNLIWYRQDTLLPLIRSLPGDLWSVEVTEDQRTGQSHQYLRLTGTRPIVQSDWDRYDLYARRVRFLTFREPGSLINLYASQDAYSALYAAKGSSLLPSLQDVVVNVVSPQITTSLLKCIACPSLTKISLGVFHGILPEEEARLSDGLVAVTALCPAVEEFHLRLSLFGRQGIDIPSLAKPLSLWNNLRSSSCSIYTVEESIGRGQCIDLHMLSRASSMPKLHELEVVSSLPFQPDTDLGDPHAQGSVIFPDLTTLALVAMSTDIATGRLLLGRCNYPHLNTLSVVASEDTLLTVLSLLPTHVTSDALEVCKLESLPAAGPPSQDTSPVILGYTELRPLAGYRNMRELSLELSGRFTCELDDDAWEAFALSWPRILYVEFIDSGGRDDGTTTVRPSYRALAHLARHCSELRTIRMTLRDDPDATGHPMKLDSLPVSDNMEYLDLGYSSFSNLRLTASWIARMFPQLVLLDRRETIGAQEGPSEAVSPSVPWRELFDMVKAL